MPYYCGRTWQHGASTASILQALHLSQPSASAAAHATPSKTVAKHDSEYTETMLAAEMLPRHAKDSRRHDCRESRKSKQDQVAAQLSMHAYRPGTSWPIWSTQAASGGGTASGSLALEGDSSATAPSGRRAAASETIMPAGNELGPEAGKPGSAGD